MSQDLLSVLAASREYPARLAVRGSTCGDLTYKDLAKLVEAKLPTYTGSTAPVSVVADASLDSLVTIYTLLELKRPILLIHPLLTSIERQRNLDYAAHEKSSLPADTAVIIFTSGTTGQPKPVLLSRRALLASALSSAKNISLNDGDVWQMTISPARIGGFSIITRSLIARSAISLAPKFDPKDIVKSWDEDEVTLVSVVPTMLIRVMDEIPEWRPKSKFRAFLVGGSPASQKLKKRAREKNFPLIMTYGMTEATSNVVSTPYELKDEVTLGCGKLNAGAELEVREGKIFIRGPMLFDGYWGRASVFKDGWFETGDMGFIDKEGFVHVQGRERDLIVSGGDNVHPIDVESALESLPGIKEALVTGKPDETWGAIVTALLVPKNKQQLPSAAEIAEGLKPILAKYRFPRRYAWVSSIPKTAAAKPNRDPSILEGLELQTLHYLGRNN